MHPNQRRRARLINLIGCGLITLLFVTVWTTPSPAQVFLESDQGQFTLTNRSPVDLVDISWGTRSLGELASGEIWTSEEEKKNDLTGKPQPLSLLARVKLKSWGEALNALPGNRIWAEIQLQTVGLHVSRGASLLSLIGAQQLMASINELKHADAELGEAWLSAGPLTPLKAGLLAYAARYTQVETLLVRLLPQIKPTMAGSSRDEGRITWPEGYEALPDPRSSLRAAIELHGVSALPAILESPDWSRDRGFSDVQLAFALLRDSEVLDALYKRGNDRDVDVFLERFAQEKLLSDERGQIAAEGFIKKMIQARDMSDSEMAISMATSAALLWYRHNIRPEPSKAASIICSYMDLGAQRSINEKQLLAAQAYLNLGQNVCFGHPFYRSRASEYFRTRGDLSYFDLDLEASLHWYRAAIWMSNELIDRVRLIDTLARLAIIQLTDGDIKLASSYLKEARRLDTPQVPPPDSLMAAEELFPVPDQKARVGLIILIFVLGIVALSQLLKVIFGRKGS